MEGKLGELLKKLTLMELRVFQSEEDFIQSTVAFIARTAEEVLKSEESFQMILCGGNTPIGIYKQLRFIQTDWEKWHLWLGDERVTNQREELNSQLIKESWLDFLSIKPVLHSIPLEGTIKENISTYSQAIGDLKRFDLALLGIGEDGHTASLFPENDIGLTSDSPDVLYIENAPKLPKYRISLSANCLNRANAILFIAKGREKQKIIDEVRRNERLPCSSVRGRNSTIINYLIQ